MRLGDLEILFLTDGTFKLDIGPMFGIVPRPLYLREREPDARNRMALALTVVLIRSGQHNVLVDCGIGRKWAPKQRDIYDIHDRPNLIESLASAGLQPAGITAILHTHLHHDHAGWNTQLDARGRPEPVFVNARHIVERRELEAAHHPNEVERGTYRADNILPIDATHGWEVFDNEREALPGVTMFRTGGHTIGHCAVRIESGGQRALCMSELFPTTAHRRLAWVMAYDYAPFETLAWKRRLFRECAANNTLVLLNHDTNALAVRLREAGGEYDVVKVC
jgi:glyoxylase-like metal-dependent hydrolase (beta-lactamase superfamily II)